MIFNFRPVASLKATRVGESALLTINGITTASITPENAAIQSNKLLALVGWQIVANSYMTRTQVEEAINDG